jgi:ComF family protein
MVGGKYYLLINVIRSLLWYVVYIVYPPLCLYCKNSMSHQTFLCKECNDRIRPVVSTVIIKGKYRVPILAVSAYQDPLRSLILAKNYGSIISARALGYLIWHRTYIQEQPVDVWVPIPLHWTRYASRGFNQAEEIAKTLAQYSNKPMHSLLKRRRKTRFQAECSFEERVTNVRQVFTLTTQTHSDYENKHLVLVDDLATTGATLQEAIYTLAALKPASIKVVVACRVV